MFWRKKRSSSVQVKAKYSNESRFTGYMSMGLVRFVEIYLILKCCEKKTRLLKNTAEVVLQNGLIHSPEIEVM
jgi:hypothetical protein